MQSPAWMGLKGIMLRKKMSVPKGYLLSILSIKLS